MNPKKEKRLKELETKFKLVHKGTGETFEVETGPGGVETWVDDDKYEWTGTKDEEREYYALNFEHIREQMKATTNNFKNMLATTLYGGKTLNK